MKRTLLIVLAFAVISLAHAPDLSAEVRSTKADASLAGAVQRMDRAAIRQLIDKRAEINTAQPDGTTALHWAAYHDDLDLVNRLLAAGADVRASNRYGVTPLALACINGNAAMVERFLAAGADANASLPGGETMLMTAARTGKVAAVRALLARGADVHAKEPRRGQTALHVGGGRWPCRGDRRAHQGRRRFPYAAGFRVYAAVVRGSPGTYRRGQSASESRR